MPSWATRPRTSASIGTAGWEARSPSAAARLLERDRTCNVRRSHPSPIHPYNACHTPLSLPIPRLLALVAAAVGEPVIVAARLSTGGMMESRFILMLAGVLLAAVSFGQAPRPGAAVDPSENIPSFTPVEFKDGVVTFHSWMPAMRSTGS
jgi:hypothetical protein